MSSSIRHLSPQERERLLSALRSEGDKMMLRLLLETGRPIEDLLATRTSDLDRDHKTLRLRRGGVGGRVDGRRGEGLDEEEVIRLSPELSAAVEDYIEKNPGKIYLFEGRCGRPVGPKWVRCTLLPAAIRSGIDDPAAGEG
ncbi:tyrosine-type recombinase/integrase [Candidatus Methanocrinis natronophilus]|uniref:Tyrosine-type recombinase/integrase n=1 Tax=Candidatus Methanocrinis natronophilus TaxID=3033396 RepID=A0ABT5X7P4_9EURY|nr:tyrosine-type recombinase/integrase [Candidatus Methanocrinis natronophilus]MDF0590696.1 tyrosine-type recombinase/integrase [Candidatus Methanocrinis natronophilus]